MSKVALEEKVSRAEVVSPLPRSVPYLAEVIIRLDIGSHSIRFCHERERERERESVCVCVSERERERKRYIDFDRWSI